MQKKNSKTEEVLYQLDCFFPLNGIDFVLLLLLHAP